MPYVLDGLIDANPQELRVEPRRQVDLSRKLSHPICDAYSFDFVIVGVLHLEELAIDETCLTEPVETADHLLHRPGVDMPVN